MRNGLKWILRVLLCGLLMFSCSIAPADARVISVTRIDRVDGRGYAWKEHVLLNDAFIGRWNLVPDEQNEEGELILAADGTGTMRCNTDHLLHVLYGQNWKLFWDAKSGLNIEPVEDSSGYTSNVPGGLFRIMGCYFEFDYDSNTNSILFYDCCGDVHRFEYDDSWKAKAMESISKAWMIELGDPQDYDYGYFFLNADGSGQCELRMTVYEEDELVEKVFWYSSFSWEPIMTGFKIKLDRDFYSAQLEKDKVYEVGLNGFAGYYIEDASEVKWAELEGDYGKIHMRGVEATPSDVEPIPSYESDRNQNVEYMANKTKFSVGDRVYLGKYEQDNDASNGAEDIKWRILDIEDGQALLLSEYILDGCRYSLDRVVRYWEGSNVRAWLNEGFLQCAFSETEASNIQKSVCTNGNNDPDNKYATADWIFLLSADEVEHYMQIDADRRTIATDYALVDKKVFEQYNGYSEWWLRDAAYSTDYKGKYVSSAGFVAENVATSSLGIRPAMWYALPEGAILEEKDTYDSISPLKEKSFAVGDVLGFGSYEQDYDSANGSEPIMWQILSIDENNIALAISVKVLDRKVFHEHNFGSESLDDSTLIAWLNEGFMSNAFTDEEAAYMRYFPFDDLRSSYKVALLLISEVEQFMPALKEGLEAETEFVKRQCEDGDEGWWVYRVDEDPEELEWVQMFCEEEKIGEYRLRMDKGDGMIVSYETGEIQAFDDLYYAGVRPLIRIQLNHSSEENGMMKEQQKNTDADAVYETQDAANADFQWEIREDNTVSLVRYTGKKYKITIPAEYEGLPVTEIADGAFEECSLLGEVVIPENVIRIGTKAFYKCNLLEKVVLPAGEIEFGKFAFNNCPNVVLHVQTSSPAEEYAQERTLKYSNE